MELHGQSISRMQCDTIECSVECIESVIMEINAKTFNYGSFKIKSHAAIANGDILWI